MADQRLYKIRGQDWTYHDLKFTGTVNPDYIRRHWKELLRLAGSIKSGRVTASLFLSKLQAYPRQKHLIYVLQAYGQLIKTRFILRYLQSQPQRQRIHAQLNKGEELHALWAWLWFGSEGIIRRRQQEAQTEALPQPLRAHQPTRQILLHQPGSPRPATPRPTALSR